jgi:hypothetical protein
VRVIAVGFRALLRVQVYLVTVAVLVVTLAEILSAVVWLPVMVRGTFATAVMEGVEVRPVSLAVLTICRQLERREEDIVASISTLKMGRERESYARRLVHRARCGVEGECAP